MPQKIGKFWPSRHNYYLLDKFGNILSRTQNQTTKGRVAMTLQKDSIIRIEFNNFSNSISFKLLSKISKKEQKEDNQVQDQEQQSSARQFKRYVKKMSKQDYRLCIITAGTHNHFKVKQLDKSELNQEK